MKAQDIIDKVDGLMPNQYDSDTKLGWLSELDGQIFDELISTHYGTCIKEFEPYKDSFTDLLIDFPYGGKIYTYYLEAMIAAQNSETAKYNQFITLFNSEYQSYVNRYNRTHMPKQRFGNRLHY